MPEILSNYIEDGSIASLAPIYSSIWDTYKNDVEKYANNSTDSKIIKHIISIAHLYLDERITLKGFGKSNYRSCEVRESFRNLDDAKIIRLIYPTTDKTAPLKPDIKKSPRMQFLDTGLVNNELNIQANLLKMSDLSSAVKGRLIPHLITQELISLNTYQDTKPIFWVRDKKQSSAELDILLQINETIIPVEIKSGKTGTLKSLHQFLEQSNSSHAIRIYGGEFSVEKHKTPIMKKDYHLMNLPYYLGTKLKDYAEYLINAFNL